jgi:hypothetical protein
MSPQYVTVPAAFLGRPLDAIGKRWWFPLGPHTVDGFPIPYTVLGHPLFDGDKIRPAKSVLL